MSGPAPRAPRLGPLGLAIGLGLGAALRLAWQLRIASEASYWVPHGNAAGFLRLARELAAGDLLLGDEPFFYGPFYPYFLAGCFALVGGESLVAPRLVQALLGLALAVLVFAVTRRLFDARAAAWAGALLLCYGPALFFEGLLVSATPSTFLLVLGLWLVLPGPAGDAPPAPRESWRRAGCLVLAGAAVGLACWGRGNLLLLLPIFAAYLLAPGRWPGEARPAAWRAGLLRAAAFTLGASALILPVTARNALRGGDLVLLVSQGGANFFVGNNPESPGWFRLPEAAGLVDDADQAWFEGQRAVAERELGRSLRPSEVSRYWFSRSLAWMRAEPAAAAALQVRKLRLLLDPYELPIHRNAGYYLAAFPLGRLLPGWGLLLPLALAGLALVACAASTEGQRAEAGRDELERRRARGLLVLLALVYAGTVVAFFVNDRYRFPLVPLLAPFAGLAAARFARAGASLARGQRLGPAARPLGGAFGVFGLSLVLFNGCIPGLGVSVVGPEVRARFLTVELHRQGRSEEMLGDPLAALAEYERALALSPGHVPSRLRQAALLLRAGRLDEAGAVLRTLHRLRPDLAEAEALLAEVERALGDEDPAGGRSDTLPRQVPPLLE